MPRKPVSVPPISEEDVPVKRRRGQRESPAWAWFVGIPVMLIIGVIVNEKSGRDGKQFDVPAETPAGSVPAKSSDAPTSDPTNLDLDSTPLAELPRLRPYRQLDYTEYYLRSTRRANVGKKAKGLAEILHSLGLAVDADEVTLRSASDGAIRVMEENNLKQRGEGASVWPAGKVRRKEPDDDGSKRTDPCNRSVTKDTPMKTQPPPGFDVERFFLPVMPKAWHEQFDPVSTALAVFDVYEVMEKEGQEPGASKWTEGSDQTVRLLVTDQWGTYMRFTVDEPPLADAALLSMWKRLQAAPTKTRHHLHKKIRDLRAERGN